MFNNMFPQPISQEIWERKYKLTTPNPEIQNDENVGDTWKRIAVACAYAPITMTGNKVGYEITKSTQQAHRDQFYEALYDFKFLPAGRIIAGAGSGRQVTLFNCYVMGIIPDDLNGIFDMLREAALTMQQGGGIGYDFSPLRPSGAPVKGVDADASGPLSFMDVWDAMCRTIMSAGARRGAMMATIRCDHPDVMNFITAKREKGRLNMFNMSVMATDEFMDAVIHNKDWALCHEVAPTVPVNWYNHERPDKSSDSLSSNMKGDKYIYQVIHARDLWDAMMENTYNHAEPGVLFVDRINKMNNLWYVEDISSTNPCGEQPLPPYGACLLGSINLSRFVKVPFYPDAVIDYDKIIKTTKAAVRMLDAVIDISNFPLPQQEAEAKYKRRMGLGITGLADMLFMLNLPYDSEKARDIAANVMKTITLAAYQESIQLAIEYGPCPAVETLEQRSQFIKSGFLQQDGIPNNLREDILRYGIRNALLTSIAPTGTISMYAGNVSSGIEPVFAASYLRKVLEDDGVTKVEQEVTDYGVLKHREHCASLGIKSKDHLQNLTTAQTLSPYDHLMMQAAVQNWVDSSISKTINCPEDITFDDFKDIYMEAYNSGLKGCTTYRPNDTLGSVLTIIEEKPSEPVQEDPVILPVHTKPTPRLKSLSGQTYKLKWQNSNFYVTINNHVDDNGQVIPFEIFINTQDMSHFQWTVALTRMMSSVFRRGGDITFVIEDLKSIMDPNGGAWIEGKYVPSFIALLGSTLESHLKLLNHDEIASWYAEEEAHQDTKQSKPMQCPSCKGFNMVISGGCPTCGDCGHSKCG